MDDMTQMLIYNIKNNNGKTIEDAAVEFMAEYTGTTAEQYPKDALFDIASAAVKDFVGSARNCDARTCVSDLAQNFETALFNSQTISADTRKEVRRIFTHAMLHSLMRVRVREGGKFVNGFNDYFELQSDLIAL